MDKEATTGYSKLITGGSPVISLWVIDEISMISDPYEIEKILKYSELIPIIIMGDPAQLRNPGNQKLSPLFTSNQVIHSTGLKEVMRTGKENPLIDELTKIRSNIRSSVSPLSYETKITSEGDGIIYLNNGSEIIKDLLTSEEDMKSTSYVKIVGLSNEKISCYAKAVGTIL